MSLLNPEITPNYGYFYSPSVIFSWTIQTRNTIILHSVSCTSGRAMAEAVSGWLPTAAA
jgi:hypothetical protein